jgi:hypothetical protein
VVSSISLCGSIVYSVFVVIIFVDLFWFLTISSSMWWSRSWYTSSYGSCNKIFGGMEPTEMDIMIIWRLIDYDIVVKPN